MVALVLADAVLEKFGGDSVRETARNVRGGNLDALPDAVAAAVSEGTDRSTDRSEG